MRDTLTQVGPLTRAARKAARQTPAWLVAEMNLQAQKDARARRRFYQDAERMRQERLAQLRGELP